MRSKRHDRLTEARKVEAKLVPLLSFDDNEMSPMMMGSVGDSSEQRNRTDRFSTHKYIIRILSIEYGALN